MGIRSFLAKVGRLGRIVLVCLVMLAFSAQGKMVAYAAGNQWTNQVSNTVNDLAGPSYGLDGSGNGLWIAGQLNGEIDKSSNGRDWTLSSPLDPAFTGYFGNAVYASSQWVLVGQRGEILTSPDATTWKKQVSNTSNDLLSVAYGNGFYVAVGTSGTIDTSHDGSSWTPQAVGPGSDFEWVTFGGGQFVAVGDSGMIYTSIDGTTWTAESSHTFSNIDSIIDGNGTFVAVGDGGLVLTSPDGKTWTTQTSGTSSNLYGVTYGAGKFVAVGPSSNNGTIISSSDGVAWTSETPVSMGTETDFYGVAYGGQMFVAVGGTYPSADGVIETQSNNADLSAVTLSSGSLSPAFAASTTSYTASVPYTVSSLKITADTADPTSTMTIDGSSVTSGSAKSVPLNVGANSITMRVTAQTGLTKTYTVTVTRQAASTNANLSNLTLGKGTLSPSFTTGTTSYTASVLNTTSSVDVTPTVADSTATVTVNGATATSGTAVNVPLSVGSNTITVKVTAQDGATTKTYTVAVTRALSSNANLSSLTLSSGPLTPSFAASTTAYTSSVSNGVSSVDVTPTLADSTATVTVNGVTATSGSPVNVPLSVGNNTITVQVTAGDGVTTNTYTVTVTRAPSSNANLSSLTLSSGPLTPGFAAGTTTYTSSVSNGVTSVDVTPTLADSSATVTVNGSPATSGSPVTVPLTVGPNTITVSVTAGDGTTTNTYTVTVTRALSSNANLSNLTLSSGTLTPGFSAGTTLYTADVPNSVANLSVTPTLADSTATVTVNGIPATSGSAVNVPLTVGGNVITVQVTAENGVAINMYTVMVTRAMSSNADLSGLTLDKGTLTPSFAVGTTAYTADVANSVSSVNVTPTPSDSNATVLVNGVPAISGSAVPVPLIVGSNTITVQVTAQDGSTTKTYTVTVMRALSSNANLSSLNLSNGTLTPGFAAGTTTYTSSVANSVSSIDVTPTVADMTATVAVNGRGVISGTAVSVPLKVGNNTISVAVVAQDGTTTKTYTVTVTRAPSSNANLSSLTLSTGTLTPGFAAGTTTYTASVPNSVSSIDITPTVADSTATVVVNGRGVMSGTAVSVPLQVGSNAITVKVTAQDGLTTNTYTVSVARAPSSNANLSSLTLSNGTLTPGFAAGTTTYTASVANGVSSVSITPTVADSTATVAVNGRGVMSGTAVSVPLQVGSNTISVVVVAQDGRTTKTYTVTMTRAQSGNNNLSNLTLNHGMLTPVFGASTTDYLADVPYTVNSVQVTPTVADSTASVTVDKASVRSGQSATVPLNVGDNVLVVSVKAQDGSVKTYTVTVKRDNLLAPTGLRHGSLGITGWVENWQSVPGAASYDVYINGIKVGSTTQTTYTFTNMQAQTAYDVTVTAVNGSDASTASSADVVKTLNPLLISTPSVLPNGLEGAGYSQNIQATGGLGPYSFTLSGGQLPSGLTLSSDGTLSGSAHTSGDTTFQVTVTDANGAVATKDYTLYMIPAAPLGYLHTVNLSQIVDNNGGNLKTTEGQTQAVLIIAPGTFTNPVQIHLTSGSIPSGLLPANWNLITAFGVNFDDAQTPGKPLTFSLTNPNILPTSKVYKVLGGQLIPVQAQVSAGKATIQFTNDPTFVVVQPPVAVPNATKPVTGFPVQVWTASGLLVVVLGGGLLWLYRRRSSNDD